MKTFSIICAVATVAPLFLVPVSIDLSISVIVAAGILALVARDYSQEIAPVRSGE